MATRRLLLKQFLSIILYILFFAVQLHLRYADVRMIELTASGFWVGGSSHSDGKFEKAPANGLHSQFNLKLNKRYFPSDLLLLSFATLSDALVFSSGALKHYDVSGALITQTGLAGSDRGPPSAIGLV